MFGHYLDLGRGSIAEPPTNYIDRSAASVPGQTTSSVRAHKENGFTLNGKSNEVVDRALGIYYDDVIRTAVRGLEGLLSETRKLPRFEQPIPIAISGGSAKVDGFEARVRASVEELRSPVDISEVRVSNDPLNTTARGALMAATLDM